VNWENGTLDGGKKVETEKVTHRASEERGRTPPKKTPLKWSERKEVSKEVGVIPLGTRRKRVPREIGYFRTTNWREYHEELGLFWGQLISKVQLASRGGSRRSGKAKRKAAVRVKKEE